MKKLKKKFKTMLLKIENKCHLNHEITLILFSS
jgi:hypothetical protein